MCCGLCQCPVVRHVAAQAPRMAAAQEELTAVRTAAEMGCGGKQGVIIPRHPNTFWEGLLGIFLGAQTTSQQVFGCLGYSNGKWTIWRCISLFNNGDFHEFSIAYTPPMCFFLMHFSTAAATTNCHTPQVASCPETLFLKFQWLSLAVSA